MSADRAMTVAVLQEILSNYPPERRVVVEGQEMGYDDPIIGYVRIRVDENKNHGATSLRFGRHGEAGPHEAGEECVLIGQYPWTLD